MLSNQSPSTSIADMDLMKRVIPAQARIWRAPSPALLDSRLRGNDQGRGFLVTPLCGVTFFLALCAMLGVAG